MQTRVDVSAVPLDAAPPVSLADVIASAHQRWSRLTLLELLSALRQRTNTAFLRLDV